MKHHNWEIKEDHGGPDGSYKYWECSDCKACGGIVFSETKLPFRAFLAGKGLALPKDCEKSSQLIANYYYEHRKRIYLVEGQPIEAETPSDAVYRTLSGKKGYVDTFEVLDKETGQTYQATATYSLKSLEIIEKE